MRDALKILCWNIDDAVWNHWEKVVGKEVVLTRALDLDKINFHLEFEKGEAFQYLFVFLEDKDFSRKVENVVELRRQYPQLKVVVFPNQPSQTAALRLFSIGVNGQCSPYIGEEQLALALSVIESGEIWGGRSFIQNLISQSVAQSTESPDAILLSELSGREGDVVGFVAHGLSNKQIALEMDITERTVKSHLTAAFKKTHTKDRLSLALLVQGSSYMH